MNAQSYNSTPPYTIKELCLLQGPIRFPGNEEADDIASHVTESNILFPKL